jgi:DNA-directed RNA polymerase subunit RPC12/RpoP
MIVVVLQFSREIASPLRQASIPDGLVNIVLNIVYLVALGIGYVSFYDLVLVSMPDYGWGYSLAFSLMALLPIGRISLICYRSLDNLTDIVSKKLIESRLESDENTVCPYCSYDLITNAVFCSNCGSKIL